MSTPAAILDMDGTLCDVSSIRYHVNPTHAAFSGRKRFDLFHAASIDCPPHRAAIREYEHSRRLGQAILIVTARKLMWRYHTMFWLLEHQIVYDELLMRKDNDDRPDYEVKADILRDLRQLGYAPQVAVDDNPAVIRLWKDHGIPTVQIPGWA